MFWFLFLECSSHKQAGNSEDGVYSINPDGGEAIDVYCHMTDDAWVVIQRHIDDSVDFTRGWTDYVTGFGDLTGNLWLGLDNIHRLTAVGHSELIVDITDVSGMDTSTRYTSFAVGNATTSYRLSVSGHIGIMGGGLGPHSGYAFTTSDSDNDGFVHFNCADFSTAGWWYTNCYACNLNGPVGTQYFSWNGGQIRKSVMRIRQTK